MNNIFYVYAHIRPDTGKVFYIGKGCKYRAYKTRRDSSSIWKRIVKKNNGVFKVELLFKNLPENEAFAKERMLIIQYGRINNKTGCLANLTDGGEGASGYKFTEAQMKKIRLSRKTLKGPDNPKYGIPLTEDCKRKLSISQKLRLKNKTIWNKGRKHSPETRRKISEINKGKISWMKGKNHTEKSKLLMSEKRTGKNNYQTKPIINTITGEVIAYGGTMLFNLLKIKSRTTINYYLNGQMKKPDWFTYEYKN